METNSKSPKTEKIMRALLSALVLAMILAPVNIVHAASGTPVPSFVVMSSGESYTFTEPGFNTTGGFAYRVEVYQDWWGNYNARIYTYMRYGISGAPVKQEGVYYTSFTTSFRSTEATVWQLRVVCTKSAKSCVVYYPQGYSVGQGGYSF